MTNILVIYNKKRVQLYAGAPAIGADWVWI